MKKLLMLTLAITLCIGLGISMTQAGDAAEAKWFDLENCAMCTGMMAEKGLMENMTWEQHNISNGILSVATVTPEYKEAFGRSCAARDAQGQNLWPVKKWNYAEAVHRSHLYFQKVCNMKKLPPQTETSLSLHRIKLKL